MDPISLLVIAAISLLGGTASAATIAYLTLPQVKAWFQARRAALLGRDAVAATVVDLLASGQYRTVQGRTSYSAPPRRPRRKSPRSCASPGSRTW
jgi:hypothetical protein